MHDRGLIVVFSAVLLPACFSFPNDPCAWQTPLLTPSGPSASPEPGHDQCTGLPDCTPDSTVKIAWGGQVENRDAPGPLVGLLRVGQSAHLRTGSQDCGIGAYPYSTTWHLTNPSVALFLEDDVIGVAPGETVLYGMVDLTGPRRRADLFVCTGNPSPWRGDCKPVGLIRVVP